MLNELKEVKKLVENGWCQKKLEINETNCGTQYCIMGAIFKVCRNLPNQASLITNAFAEANQFRKDYKICDIICWNDDPTRTKEEVLEAFDKAINLC